MQTHYFLNINFIFYGKTLINHANPDEFTEFIFKIETFINAFIFNSGIIYNNMYPLNNITFNKRKVKPTEKKTKTEPTPNTDGLHRVQKSDEQDGHPSIRRYNQQDFIPANERQSKAHSGPVRPSLAQSQLYAIVRIGDMESFAIEEPDTAVMDELETKVLLRVRHVRF